MPSDADNTHQPRAAPGEPDVPADADAPPLAPTGEGGTGEGDAAPAGGDLGIRGTQY